MKQSNKLSWWNSAHVLLKIQIVLYRHPSFLRNSRHQPASSEKARKILVSILSGLLRNLAFPQLSVIQDSKHNFLWKHVTGTLMDLSPSI